MKKYTFVKLLFVAGALVQNQAFADTTEYERTMAVGVGAALNQKAYGNETPYSQLSGEVSLYGYRPVSDRLLIRPGVRFGYTWGDNTRNVPSSVNITERDFKAMGEMSLLMTGFRIGTQALLPAITVGGGMINRSTSLSTQGPFVNSGSNAIAGSSLLGMVHGQVSVIVPFMNGQFDVAPYLRYTHVFADSRIGWFYGAEATFRVF
jgi:hypothetical protein